MRTMDSHLDFDLDLAKSQSQENPVYYIQYAHARICSILAKSDAAADQTIDAARLHRRLAARLTEPETRMLMRQLFQFPMMAAVAAQVLEPQGITSYLQKLAELFHAFYTKQRVISEDVELTRARLGLVRATRIVLANGLALLGVTAPDRM
jgi:arginyl-tRNA synthetase